MCLVYTNYLFIVIIIYLIYKIKYSDKEINKKYILMFLCLTLIITGITITGFINKKNQLTNSTVKVYSLFYDSMSQTTYSNKVETIEDVKKLMDITKDINENLEVLKYNLSFSEFKVYDEDDEKFYVILNDLNNYLSEFIFQHNRLYSKKIYIDENIKEKYSKIKTELNIIYDYLRKVTFTSRDGIGVKKYYLVPRNKEKDFDWVVKIEERVENLRELILEDNNIN